MASAKKLSDSSGDIEQRQVVKWQTKHSLYDSAVNTALK